MSRQIEADQSLEKINIFEHLSPVYLKKLKEHDFKIKISSGEINDDTVFDQEHFLGMGVDGYVLKTTRGHAVKIFFPRTDSEISNKELFLHEALLLSNLDKVGKHKNLADTVGIGKVIIGTIEVPCIIKEYVPFGLAEEIKSGGLDPAESLNVTRDIASVLEHLYDKTNGDVVTDLTPDNIRRRETGEWVLTDPGSTANSKRESFVSSDIIFSAPECKVKSFKELNANASESSMVYSLAMIYYQTLTGQNINVFDVALRSQNDFVLVENIDAKVKNKVRSQQIFQVLQKALSEDPASRYSTPDEFATALEKATLPEAGESLISPKLRDFSGKPENFVRDRVEHILEYAKSMVVFPDLGPTDEREGLLPTGSVTEIELTEAHKDWLKLLGGSDMGCGMEFAAIESPMNDEDAQKKLDQISDRISNGEIWLGGGNHFIDIMEDANGKHYVAIHTGAPRDEQLELNQIVEQAKLDGDWEKATAEYVAKYNEIIKSASDNREKILAAITEVYGQCDVLYHKPHNTIDIDKEKNTVTIYKGAVHVTDLAERQFLPSSMNEGAVMFIPGPSVGEKTHFGVPHGTGKARSSHDQREIEDVNIFPDIMLPTQTKGRVSRAVAEGAYNPYAKTEEIMLNHGLARYDREEDIIKYKTVAHISK